MIHQPRDELRRFCLQARYIAALKDRQRCRILPEEKALPEGIGYCCLSMFVTAMIKFMVVCLLQWGKERWHEGSDLVDVTSPQARLGANCLAASMFDSDGQTFL